MSSCEHAFKKFGVEQIHSKGWSDCLAMYHEHIIIDQTCDNETHEQIVLNGKDGRCRFRFITGLMIEPSPQLLVLLLGRCTDPSAPRPTDRLGML